MRAVERLIRREELRLEDDWGKLRQPQHLKTWMDTLTAPDWNVFIEGPPQGKSHPRQVLKYLARYMSGGPIADSRIISDDHKQVTFWARSKNKQQNHRRRPFPLTGAEFVRRWSMHILPKGFTRSRCYGGFSNHHRKTYLRQCRERLSIQVPAPAAPTTTDSAPKCPRCKIEMLCIERQPRPSWREVFDHQIHRHPSIYSPLLHINQRGPPALPAWSKP